MVSGIVDKLVLMLKDSILDFPFLSSFQVGEGLHHLLFNFKFCDGIQTRKFVCLGEICLS